MPLRFPNIEQASPLTLRNRTPFNPNHLQQENSRFTENTEAAMPRPVVTWRIPDSDEQSSIFVAKTAVMYQPSRQGEQIYLIRSIVTSHAPDGDNLEERSDIRIVIVEIKH